MGFYDTKSVKSPSGKLAIYADDTTVYSCLGKTNDVFDKVEMAAELEVDLRTVVE